MDSNNAVIVSAVRTPIGEFGGSFKDVLAGDLSAVVMKEAIRRAGIDSASIEEIIWGHCIQDFDEINTGRVAALKAGIPIEVPAYTVNRLCNSSLQALINASLMVKWGEDFGCEESGDCCSEIRTNFMTTFIELSLT